MKAILSLAMFGIAIAWGSAVVAEDATEKMAGEMKKCDVCKNLAENPELMMSMGWETHKIDNGMLSLITVPKDKKKDFDKVNGKLRQAIDQAKADAKAGKEVHLCSFCSEMAQLMKAGAKQQHIETESGEIELCTSDDPAVVKQIHELADKAIAIQKQIAESEKTASLQ